MSSSRQFVRELPLSPLVWVAIVMVLSGKSACQEDYVFAPQSQVSPSPTPTPTPDDDDEDDDDDEIERPTPTPGPTVTPTLAVTPTPTATPGVTPTPTPSPTPTINTQAAAQRLKTAEPNPLLSSLVELPQGSPPALSNWLGGCQPQAALPELRDAEGNLIDPALVPPPPLAPSRDCRAREFNER